MKRLTTTILIFALFFSTELLASYTTSADAPFAPAAGQAGSTAIYKDSSQFIAWASGYQNYIPGSNVDSSWQTPVEALGKAEGTSFDIVSLGRGGQITLTFTNPIKNGSGYDFAVFENSFSDGFLELGYVEVSSDGIHFVRFHNYSFTLNPVGGYDTIDPTELYGYASKYKQGYGTPFDLAELADVYADVIAGTDNFSAAFRQQMINNYPQLDLNNIQYIRLIDIVGDELNPSYDSEGFPIYDPYPTVGSAGLDLDAIGVINQVDPTGDPQSISFPSIDNQLYSNSSITLDASATSGLPITYTILSGPASLSGSTLTFTGKGEITVRAEQSGDASYAPATAVSRSFYVADALQHIYFEPVPNQLLNTSNVQLNAYSSSGLAVKMEVMSGPTSAIVDINSHLFSIGNQTGTVAIRAYQPGNSTYAPAEDVIMSFAVVTQSNAQAPLSFSEFASANGLSGTVSDDFDKDGKNDLEEFVAATNPTSASSRPTVEFIYDAADTATITFTMSRKAQARVIVKTTTDLMGAWSIVTPEIIDIADDSINGVDAQIITVEVPKIADAQFWRLEISE